MLLPVGLGGLLTTDAKEPLTCRPPVLPFFPLVAPPHGPPWFARFPSCSGRKPKKSEVCREPRAVDFYPTFLPSIRTNPPTMAALLSAFHHSLILSGGATSETKRPSSRQQLSVTPQQVPATSSKHKPRGPDGSSVQARSRVRGEVPSST